MTVVSGPLPRRVRANLSVGCARALVAMWLCGCAADREKASAGGLPWDLPPQARADYAIFAERCSKCHSLARPLNSSIADRDWPAYVERMRLQPSSGISPDDVPPILRFLHYYTIQLRDPARAAEPKEEAR